MAIGVDQIYLSMQNPDTGEYLTADVYTVDGVYEADGVTPRLLSIGQLVMAVCLQRASELETDIIKKMSTLERTTEQLELMTQIENAILEGVANMDDINTSRVNYQGQNMTFYNFLVNEMEMDNVPSEAASASDTDLLTAIEAKMDEKNTFSQQTMIELQSQTTKRDQAYDMISNVLKSVNTVLVGNANNL